MGFKHFYAHAFGERYIKSYSRIGDGMFITQISKESSFEVSLGLNSIIMKVLSRYRENPTRLG
jgi:hypothetical protein